VLVAIHLTNEYEIVGYTSIWS